MRKLYRIERLDNEIEKLPNGVVYISGSQHWKHSGPPKISVNILAAHHTFLKTIGLFYTFNCVKINKFDHLLILLELIRLTFEIICYEM